MQPQLAILDVLTLTTLVGTLIYFIMRRQMQRAAAHTPQALRSTTFATEAELLMQGDAASAIERLTTYLSQPAPAHTAAARLLRAEAYLSLNNVAAARADAEAALAQNPTLAEAFRLRAACQQAAGEAEQARISMEYAHRLEKK